MLGKIKGRLGGAVYRVQDGQQIISERAVTVLNPKSPAQIAQRAVFGFSSLIGKNLSYPMIAGWSAKPNIARASLVRSIMKACTIDTTDPDNPVVSVEANKVVISDGMPVPLAHYVLVSEPSSTDLNLQATFPEGTDVFAAMFVVLVFDYTGKTCLGALSVTADVEASTMTAEAKLDLGYVIDSRARKYFGYVVPLVDKTSYVRTNYDDVVSYLNNDAYCTQVAIELSKRNIYRRSIYGTTYDVEPL